MSGKLPFVRQAGGVNPALTKAKAKAKARAQPFLRQGKQAAPLRRQWQTHRRKGDATSQKKTAPARRPWPWRVLRTSRRYGSKNASQRRGETSRKTAAFAPRELYKTGVTSKR